MNLRAIAAGMVVGAGIGAAIVGPAPAHADPGYPNCDTVPWGFLGHQRRTICDGPIVGGQWQRARAIWTPAHEVPLTCNSYGGGSFSSTTCGGGYWVDNVVNDRDTYTVTPGTVLPDEPGHLGGGTEIA